MEKLIHLDTHVVVWLYAGETGLFTPTAMKILNHKPLGISPMVLLELQYLFEVERIKVQSEKIFHSLEKSIGLKICDHDFGRIVTNSLKQTWTRDPFDRLIVAEAALAKTSLITKDETILKHYSGAVWK